MFLQLLGECIYCKAPLEGSRDQQKPQVNYVLSGLNKFKYKGCELCLNNAFRLCFAYLHRV